MKKTKRFIYILMAVNIVLLVFLSVAAVSVLVTGTQGDDAAVDAPPETEDQVEVMGEGGEDEDELQNYIDNMKALADKHGVDSYFLQELFPDKIVYWFGGHHVYADVNENWPKHAYNWDNLQKDENGVLRYVENGEETGIFGIDVSKYQGDIDWQKVKDAGVGYAILRAGNRGYGTGEIVEDEYFGAYLEGATAVEIPVGAYFFSQAVNAEEAVEEAEFVLAAIEGYDVNYPIVFDMEEISESPNRTQALTAAEITDIAIAFCRRVEEAGHTPMIYGNVSWFLAKMEWDRLDGYAKWFAQYRPQPYYPYQFEMWQYTPRGTVDGIEGDVDMNISFVDYAAE